MRPKMSGEYLAAMLKADRDLQELGPKIEANIQLTPQEAERLLNSNWTVYLYALMSRDIQEAKDTASFIKLISEFLGLCGYVVTFSNNVYCVVPKGRK